MRKPDKTGETAVLQTLDMRQSKSKTPERWKTNKEMPHAPPPLLSAWKYFPGHSMGEEERERKSEGRSQKTGVPEKSWELQSTVLERQELQRQRQR